MSTIPHLKLCRVCGEAKPLSEYHKKAMAADGYDGRCKACKRARYFANHEEELQKRRDNYYQNHEQRLAYCREHNITHREVISERNRARYARNQEQEREKRRIWRQENPDRVRAWKRREYQKNREKQIDKAREWRLKNPERARAYHNAYWRARPIQNRLKVHRRRLIVLDAGAEISAELWRAMCDWFGNTCLCCGASAPLTMDHVIPVTRGGTNEARNLQPLCRSCNSSKGDRTVDYRDPKRLQDFLNAHHL